jgi:hypothetical protein
LAHPSDGRALPGLACCPLDRLVYSLKEKSHANFDLATGESPFR